MCGKILERDSDACKAPVLVYYPKAADVSLQFVGVMHLDAEAALSLEEYLFIYFSQAGMQGSLKHHYGIQSNKNKS